MASTTLFQNRSNLQKNFLLSTDGVVLATWVLMSLVFGLSIVTGPYSLMEQIVFLAITAVFGSFLLYTIVFSRTKPSLKVSVKTEEQQQHRQRQQR
jgi:uncharacterized membrane protein YeiH